MPVYLGQTSPWPMAHGTHFLGGPIWDRGKKTFVFGVLGSSLTFMVPLFSQLQRSWEKRRRQPEGYRGSF